MDCGFWIMEKLLKAILFQVTRVFYFETVERYFNCVSLFYFIVIRFASIKKLNRRAVRNNITIM